jgi:hypothetical protein
VAEYTKDTRFSWGWVIGGIVLMFVTAFLGEFILIGTGNTSFELFIAVRLGCFAIGGFVIGWQSEGRTILEAGIAAVASMAIVFAAKSIPLILDGKLALLFYGLPFLAAVIGAFLGEKLQGDIIYTKDD